MNKYSLITVAVAIQLAITSYSVIAGTSTGNVIKTSAAKGSGVTQTTASEILWAKTPFGPFASPVYGNFAAGQHITYIKFPPGMKTPVHTHTSDYTGLVIQGVTRHYSPDAGAEKKDLDAGSHWSVKGGVPHISECLPGAECIMALYQNQSFDFLPQSN